MKKALFYWLSYVAVVIDTDGSAFITKAEFDSLKSNFQAQIDNYNSSIDNKIDGAIASYLAGISVAKTTNEQFFDGSGAKAVLINSNRNSGLVVPWGFLSATEVVGKIARDPDTHHNQQVAGNVRFVRTDESDMRPGEVFRVDDATKFRYYSNVWNYSLNVNLTWIQSVGGIGQYKPQYEPNMYIRWWGAYSGKRKYKENSNPPWTNTGSFVYGTEPKFCSWFAWDCTYYWQGSWYIYDPFEIQYNYSATLEERSFDKVYWIFDSSTQTSGGKNMWVNWDTSDQKFLLNNCDTKATDGWDTTGENWSVDYPDQHNVKPECLVGIYSGGASGGTSGFYTSAKWCGVGTYASTATDPDAGIRPSPPTASLPWEEPLQKLSILNQKNIENENFNTETLNTYSGFGFTGKIHQGLPLYLFKKAGSVAFDLDTTGIGGNVVFALKTSPFDCTATAIHNTPLSTGIRNLKLDGASVSGGAMTLSQGVHTIRFDVEGASESSKVPVFFMFGYPSSLTVTPRYIVTLPKSFQFTIEN